MTELVAAQTVSKDKPSLEDESSRRMAVLTSPLLALLASPCFVPVEGDRSLWQLARYDGMAQALLAGIFLWPVCLGLVGLVQGRRGKPPGKLFLGVGALLTALHTFGGMMLFADSAKHAHADERSMFLGFAGVAAALAVSSIVRSLWGAGWKRFHQLVSAMALLAGMIVLLFAHAEPSTLRHPPLGVWFFLFATAALVPFVLVNSRRAPRDPSSP